MLFNILLILDWQVFTEGSLQLLLVDGFSQSLDVKSLAGQSFLMLSFEAVVSGDGVQHLLCI